MVVTSGEGGGRAGARVSWSAGNVLDLALGGGHTGTYICKNSM